MSRNEDMPRARLASFDDCTINVTLPYDEADAHPDVDKSMSSSSAHTRNYSDGDKLIEHRPDLCFGDYNNEHTCDRPTTPDILDTNTFTEGETWLAPFHDYDFQQDVASSLYQQDAIPSTSEDLRHDPDRQCLSPRDRLFDAAIKVQAVVKLTRVQRLKKRARWVTKVRVKLTRVQRLPG